MKHVLFPICLKYVMRWYRTFTPHKPYLSTTLIATDRRCDSLYVHCLHFASQVSGSLLQTAKTWAKAMSLADRTISSFAEHCISDYTQFHISLPPDICDCEKALDEHQNSIRDIRGFMCRWLGGWIDGWTVGWLDGYINEWMDGWMDG